MKFKVGTLVMRETECLRVSCIRPEVSQITLEGSRGEQFIIEVDDFNIQVAGGKLKPLYISSAPDDIQLPARQITSAERSELDWRIELLGELDKVEAVGTWEDRLKELEKYCKSKNRRVPSKKTFSRWNKLRRDSSSRESLAPRLSSRGRKIPELHEDPFEEVVMDEIISCYCGTDKLNHTKITQFVNDKCREFARVNGVGFKGISRRSVIRRIRKLAYYLIKPGKVDSKTFDQDMRVALREIYCERPYERCEMDAACLPIFCLDANGVMIGRPWVYGALECATSSPIIIRTSIQKPSQDFVLRALEFAFTPKGAEFCEKYGLRNLWPAPVGIERVVLDNPVEHHGGAVLSALRYLGTTVDYPQAGKPQHKPFIERFFAELNNSLIYALPGSFKAQKRPDPMLLKKAMAEATLTVEELEREILKWAVDVYMQRCCGSMILDTPIGR